MSPLPQCLRYLLVAACLLLPRAAAQDSQAPPPVDPATLVPADTILHVTVDGRELAASGEELALARIYREPELQRLLEEAVPNFGMARVGLSGAVLYYSGANLTLGGLLELLQGPLSVSFTGMGIREIPMISGRTMVVSYPELVITCHVGDRGDRALGALTAGVEIQEGRMKTVQVGGVEATHVTWSRGPDIWYALKAPTLLLANSRALLEQALTAPEEPLAGQEPYQEVMQRLPGPRPLVRAFANVEALRHLLEGEIPEDVLGVLDLLGLRNLRGAGYGLATEGHGFREHLFVLCPGDSPLKRALSSGGDLAAPRLLPASAGFCLAQSLDLQAAWDLCRRIMERVDPFGLRRLDAGLEHMEGWAGTSLEELLAALGKEVDLVVTMPETRLVPCIGLLVHLRDPQVVEEFINRACRELPGRHPGVRSLPFRGHRIHHLRLRLDPAVDPAVAALGISHPAWAFTGGRLVVTPGVQALKHILVQLEDGGPRLAEHPEFAAARKRLVGDRDVQRVLWLDLKGLVSFLLDNGVPLAQALVPEGAVRFDVAKLPQTEVVARHLSGSTALGRIDETGLTWRSYGPVPGILLLLAGGASFQVARGLEADLRHRVGELQEGREAPPNPVPAPPRSRPVRDRDDGDRDRDRRR